MHPVPEIRRESHPVVELLHERSKAGSTPGRRTDQAKVGLAIEGGSMRGVVSAGMTAALEQLGLLNAFDAVYGSSAGAINGAYFIAGRAALCTSSYYEEMTTRGFIDFRRALLRRGPAVSLDFVLDDVAEEEKPLDWDAVLRSPIALHVLASSVSKMCSVDFTRFETKQQLKDALRASAHIWLLAGPPFDLDGDRWLDASLFVSTPFQAALDDGCTHVLALRTRPRGAVRGVPGFVERRFIAQRLARVAPGLRDEFLRRAERYRDEVEELERRTEHFEEPPYVLGIAPQGPTVSGSERNPARVKAGARAGIEAVYHVIAGEDPQILETLRAYPRP